MDFSGDWGSLDTYYDSFDQQIDDLIHFDNFHKYFDLKYNLFLNFFFKFSVLNHLKLNPNGFLI